MSGAQGPTPAAPDGAAAVTPMAEPTAADLRRWDGEVLWHPFTPHSVYASEQPLLVVAGAGNYLIDEHGKSYLDGVASLWCNVFGHRHPRIDAAIHDQLACIAHSTQLGNTSVPAILLARRLVEIAPAGLRRVFFSDDGATAVEVALKMAFQYWQQVDSGRHRRRRRFIAFADAYHGDTVGAVSLGGIDLFHARYGRLLFDTLRAPSPYCYRCPLGQDRETCGMACAERAEHTIAAHAEEIAAVVVEPGFQGAAGIITPPAGWLARIAAAARRAGALLICDEVASGMGRTGSMFACEREGVKPDFLCLAKGLTGGYLPMAATLTTEEVFAAFLGPPEEGRTFFHGHTYTGNQLAAAAALAVLEIFAAEDVIAGLQPKITALATALAALRGLPHVGEVRQVGLAAGIELVQDRRDRSAFPAAARTGMKICGAARRHGVFLRPLGDTIVLMPPLSVTVPELDHLVASVAAAISEALPAAACSSRDQIGPTREESSLPPRVRRDAQCSATPAPDFRPGMVAGVRLSGCTKTMDTSRLKPGSRQHDDNDTSASKHPSVRDNVPHAWLGKGWFGRGGSWCWFWERTRGWGRPTWPAHWRATWCGAGNAWWR